MSARIKRVDGVLVSSKKEVNGARKGHFDQLLNEEAIVISMGMEAGGRRVCTQRGRKNE